MPESSKLKFPRIDQLAIISVQFGTKFLYEKAELLLKGPGSRLNNVKKIKRYHDILLFIISHPDNIRIFMLAVNEMKRLAWAVRGLNPQKREELSNSGILFAETHGTFSFEIMKWLVENLPKEITIHSFDESGVHPKVLLKQVLNDMEFELLGDENSTKLKWLQQVSGARNKQAILKWLIGCVDELKVEPALKEQLFESLKLFITIRHDRPGSKYHWILRSFVRTGINEIYFQRDDLLKKFNELELINKKLPAEKKLDKAQKEEILNTARLALLLLNRETDPITYGTTEGLKLFELEHGLSIALFTMQPQMRLALESYVGFMMFKNGHPMAYGGAWLFGQRSLIGINIFGAFRGGESAFVFAQLLRTYKQAFGAEHFEVEPYQFGKNNPEGLKSGAFWFYHRFGFRPVDEKLRGLAAQEHKKIITHKGYRTPIEILKQFTKSNLAVDFGIPQPATRPLEISHFITEAIGRQFKGDRKLAFKWSQEVLKTELGVSYFELNNAEQSGFIKLSVFVALALDLKIMTTSDKKTLIQLIKEKGSSEFDYALTAHKFPFEKYFVGELLEFKNRV